MTRAIAVTAIDVRALAPRERDATLFSTFGRLQPGEAFELINDHDPKPLYYQFAAEWPGRFGWDYLQEGPDVWRVRIAKRAPGSDGRECCGCNCSRG